MDKNPFQQLLARKSIIIGVVVVLFASLVFILIDANQSQQTITQPSPTPGPTETSETSWPSVPPDKQIEGQIIVKFKPEYTDAQIVERLTRYDATIISEIEGIDMKVLRVPKGQENAIIERLKNDPYVESAEGDYSSHIMYTPNDTNFGLQYGFKNTGQAIQSITGTANADIKAEAAWDVTRGNGIKIAVLDTGIKTAHPEFAGKIVAQKSFTTPSVEDVFGHGTHVAGIIAAKTNNGQGVAGTCPDCTLVVGKVMGDNGSGATSGIASGITWAADQGAKVINLSLGSVQTSTQTTYQQAIDYAIQKGAIVVTSAGNCGGSNFSANGCTTQNQTSYPGASNGVVTVASTDNKDAKSSFSNYGSHVEVAAPGTNIYSTLPSGSAYGYKSGTSMAAPIVSGVVGLIWAANPSTAPNDIINKLYTTSDKITGTGSSWTQGRINAAKAVGTTAVSPTVSQPAPSIITPTYVCGGSGTGNVCPPTPSNGPTVFVSPTISLGIGSPGPTNTGPTQPAGTTVSPTISIGPIGGGGGNPSQPCRSIGQMSYNRNSDNNSQNDYKVRVKGESGVQGLLEIFFELIFRFIELLFRIIGINVPCLI